MKTTGNIFYVMGKSASGKDTIYKMLKQRFPGLKTVVPYTTRPVRDGEQEGCEYHFVSLERLEEMKRAGKVIECRTYHTMLGPWNYFTADDGQIDLEKNHYLMIGTLESYEKMRDYFGKEHFVPVYIYVDDGLRLERALKREKEQKNPKYAEMCRRFLADEEDFCLKNLERLEIFSGFENIELEKCVNKIAEEIQKTIQIL